MKKNISFFTVIKNVIIINFIVSLIFMISFFVVSFVYYDHKNEEIEYQTLVVYQQEDINTFNAYFKKDNLFILIKLKKVKPKEYLLDYAYHYYTIYQNNIYLEAENGNTLSYVNVNQEGIISII